MKAEETKKKKDYSGKPCDEKSLADHLKSFSDMNDCFEKLNKTKKKK